MQKHAYRSSRFTRGVGRPNPQLLRGHWKNTLALNPPAEPPRASRPMVLNGERVETVASAQRLARNMLQNGQGFVVQFVDRNGQFGIPSNTLFDVRSLENLLPEGLGGGYLLIRAVAIWRPPPRPHPRVYTWS